MDHQKHKKCFMHDHVRVIFISSVLKLLRCTELYDIDYPGLSVRVVCKCSVLGVWIFSCLNFGVYHGWFLHGLCMETKKMNGNGKIVKIGRDRTFIDMTGRKSKWWRRLNFPVEYHSTKQLVSGVPETLFFHINGSSVNLVLQ